ncbi:MAG: hypothetical protein ACE5DM_03180, partial [Candidatus Nanoarchaeia archaeon]
RFVSNPGSAIKNRYCSGGHPRSPWIDDLDNDEGTGLGGSFGSFGWGACEDTPGLEWTGSRCCGDDNRKTGPEDIRRENYIDSQKACILGDSIISNQRFMMIKYSLDGKDKLNFCTSPMCVYGLPPVAGQLVQNPNPDIYRLQFLGDGVKDISPANWSQSANERLRALNIPLKILYDSENGNGDFFTCNGPDYLWDSLKKTDDDGQAASPEVKYFNKENDLGSCQAKGIYYCSHKDGRDIGWDDEKLVNESADPFVPDIPAVSRTTPQNTYNLIHNGGFED